MKIKIIIKANSPADKTFKKNLEEKKAFRAAITNGTIEQYVEENPNYFFAPVR